MGAACFKPYDDSEPHDGPPGFGHVYSVSARQLGRGAFGEVYECFHKATWEKAAVKFIDRGWIDARQELEVFREVDIMRGLEHPCLVRLLDFFLDDYRFYLVMECCEGGQLLKRITTRMRQKHPYTEKEARDAMRALLQALAYLHAKDIVHRDIKPENLLLVSEARDDMKLSDFGLAVRMRPDKPLTEWSGTPCYMAPEMVNRCPYGKPVDMWSAGVVMFVILSGHHPFYHSSTPVMFNTIRKAAFQLTSKTWADISMDAKDLVRRLLVVDPKDRLTAQEALMHPWMATEDIILRSRSLEASMSSLIRTIARRRVKAVIYAVMLVYWLRRDCLVRRQPELVLSRSKVTKLLKKERKKVLLLEEKAPLLREMSRGEVPISDAPLPVLEQQGVVSSSSLSWSSSSSNGSRRAISR